MSNAEVAAEDGDEPEDKEMVGLKARFVQITRTMYAPDLAA